MLTFLRYSLEALLGWGFLCSMAEFAGDTVRERKKRSIHAAMDALERLSRLKESGVISDEEFENLKSKIKF